MGISDGVERGWQCKAEWMGWCFESGEPCRRAEPGIGCEVVRSNDIG